MLRPHLSTSPFEAGSRNWLDSWAMHAPAPEARTNLIEDHS